MGRWQGGRAETDLVSGSLVNISLLLADSFPFAAFEKSRVITQKRLP